MASPADTFAGPRVRARLLRELTDRLDGAGALATTVREQLAQADAAEIAAATSRLETLAEEFKVLAAEYGRLPADDPDEEGGLSGERAALEAAAARLARSSALTGGLLERMVAVSRGLLGLVSLAKDGTYSRSGRATDLAASGVRLQERA